MGGVAHGWLLFGLGKIVEAIEEFREPLTRSAATPVGKDLFTEKEDNKPLDEERFEWFRRVVGKLQWTTSGGKARPDIHTHVAYLHTRVSKSTAHDWRKLRQLLHFMQQTIDDVKIMGADDLQVLQTYVDASYHGTPSNLI